LDYSIIKTIAVLSGSIIKTVQYFQELSKTYPIGSKSETEEAASSGPYQSMRA
jgi:hypothetical protein